MTEFSSFGGFAAHLIGLAALQESFEHEALKHAAECIEATAKTKIGEYQQQAGPFSAWAKLADATKLDRSQNGYPENEPLLRTGDLRDSIEHTVGATEAHIGSNSDIALYQELGTATIPPRSFLGGAAFEEAPKLVAELGLGMVALLEGGGVKKIVR